jgi:hypothetical protein
MQFTKCFVWILDEKIDTHFTFLSERCPNFSQSRRKLAGGWYGGLSDLLHMQFVSQRYGAAWNGKSLPFQGLYRTWCRWVINQAFGRAS